MAIPRSREELEAANIAPQSTHIRLLYGYRGKFTREQFIPAGEYRRDDPVLCGLAEYLVETGHAVWVGVAQPVAVPVPEPVIAPVPDPEGTSEVEAVVAPVEDNEPGNSKREWGRPRGRKG